MILRNIVRILFSLLIVVNVFAQTPKTSEIASAPGAFSRMGFGARGIAMGNALTSIPFGQLSSYYNPALVVFQEDNSVQLGYSFLALDRSLNFLNFTRNFKFYKKDEEGRSTDEVASISGVSIGLINAGVSNIDGRDGSGLKTETYSTSENQFFVAFGLKPSENLSFGIGLKLYYYKLFEEISSTSFAIDLGFTYKLSNDIRVGGMIADINAKNKWDTTPIYDELGKSNTIEKYPLLKRFGVCYLLPDDLGIVALDYENSNMGTNILKFGTELNLVQFFKLRFGVDRFNLSNTDMIPRSSFGFQLQHNLYGMNLGVNYAFVVEPYAPSNQHIITLGIIF